ncbi:MAG: SHOCT domain-containing protein [Candidatus Woesearchaeota archaeon]
MENKDAWIWVIALIIAIFLFGGIGMYGMMGYGMMGYAPLFGMGFGWVFMLLFLGALVWFVYALVSQPGSKNDAMSILKKRYAAGEITKKQYEEMKKEIQ